MKKTGRHSNDSNRFSIVFPILTIIGIGIFFAFSTFYEKSWSYNWTGIREQIKDTILVAEFQGVSSGAVGIDGRKPKQYDRRIWIAKNATESELLKLIDYPNATIKTIAYESLLRKADFKDKTNLVIKSFDETDYPMNYQMGCSGMQMYIGEYLIEFVLYLNDQSPPPPDGYKKYITTEFDVQKIRAEYLKSPKLWK